MIGKTLSHFRITAKLGEGGMGEVWRAEDTKLGREVAIKVLPAAFTEDAERLARFEREAKVLASLNHQNIAGIHEVGEDGGVRFLAMELAEGEDLAERLARGAMPLDEALPIAMQIAEALEVAHEKGIVHRDLKPQNVKLGPDGQVKVLDFGLAKALDPADPASGAPATSLTHSPTMTAGATVAGVILGTAAYMSPEQAARAPAAVARHRRRPARAERGADRTRDDHADGGHGVPPDVAPVDDRIVFVLTRGDMYSVSALGGNPEILLARQEPEDIDFHQPTFLPDGKSLIYSVHRPSGVDTIEVLIEVERRVVYRLEGEVRLNPQVLNVPIYSATGHLLYRRDSGDVGVWALPFSLDEMAVTGDPFLVAGGGRWPSVSRDGRKLAYAEAARDSLNRLVRVAMDGSTTTVATDLAGIRRASNSPSGDRIAFGAAVGNGRELFIANLEGRTSRLTGTPESEDAPVWSPDGTALFFQRGTGEGTAIYRMPVTGNANPSRTGSTSSSVPPCSR